ncbi:MAG: SGNH/GDSL hydrolase family protein [Planctomycetota bacterium]
MAEPRRFRYWVPRVSLLCGTVLLFVATDLFAHWLLKGEDTPAPKPGFLEQLLADDLVTWKALPKNLTLTWPKRFRVPDASVRTNAHGLRMREVETEKPSGRYRIACLGDSVTFGWGVSEASAYPRALETILRERYPHRDIEVLNFGVPGYSSEQVRRLIRHRLAAWQPDLVLVAVGVNDGALYDEHTDADRHARLLETSRLPSLVTSWLHHSFIASLLGSLREPEVPTRSLTRVRRVPGETYRQNIEEIAELCEERHWPLILIDACFPFGFAGRYLEPIAHDRDLPYLDLRTLLEGLPASRPLPPTTLTLGDWPVAHSGEPVRVRFRVRIPGDPPFERAFLFSADRDTLTVPKDLPVLAELQRDAADLELWSAEIEQAPGTTLDFTFGTDRLLSPARQELSQLSKLFYHQLRVGSSDRLLETPIYEYGQSRLDEWMLEPIHPNAEGHRHIAHALAELVAPRMGEIRR